MKIEHVALWTTDLEQSRQFYEMYFGATANQKYHNPQKQFQSYFLSFDDGARLEIMQKVGIEHQAQDIVIGWAHIAVAVGSQANVDTLTERLRTDGHQVVGEPRTTGDGYYESIVLDPDGNHIEITV